MSAIELTAKNENDLDRTLLTTDRGSSVCQMNSFDNNNLLLKQSNLSLISESFIIIFIIICNFPLYVHRFPPSIIMSRGIVKASTTLRKRFGSFQNFKLTASFENFRSRPCRKLRVAQLNYIFNYYYVKID